MTFLNPEVLYYLLPLLFILFALLITQNDSQEHYFSKEVMEKLRATTNKLTLRERNVLFLFVGIFMVVALANPVIKDKEIEVKAKSSDIMIALDISDSMLAEDIYPNRLKLAKKKGLELLKLTPNDRVGVIAFAKNSYLVSPLSFDSQAVSFLLSKLKTDFITEKGTDFLSLLDVVANSSDSKGKKYLLILSDGGDKTDFSQEIESAKEKNIVVFVLGVATKKGSPIKKDNGEFIKYKGDIIITKLNENIVDFATKTGGSFIKSVNSDEDVKAMLKEINSVSEKKELKSETIQQYTPLFYYPLGLAIFILIFALSSINRGLKTKNIAVIVFSMFFLNSLELKASILDFNNLSKAKEAYENGDYGTSNKLYSEYATKNHNASSYFNSGNSLYKKGDYNGAIKQYEKAVFQDKSLNAKKYSNMGNAYAKQGDMANFQKAIKAYEESLSLEENKDTRDNLESVKKAMEKQKEQKNKNNKEKDNKNKKDGGSKDSEKGDKDSENSNKSDKDSKKEKGKKDKKKDDSKSKQQKNSSNNKKDDSNSSEDTQNNKKDLEKNSVNSSTKELKMKKGAMSEKEMKKWLQKLNKGQSSYMYQLNKNNKNKGETDEKPW